MRKLVLLFFVIGCFGACGDEGHEDETVDCSKETRDDNFTVGLAKTGGNGMTLTLSAMDPGPPAKGDNTWTVSVTNAGSPVEGLTIDVDPQMPDHGHGTPIKAEVTAGGEAGSYVIEKINLLMPGYWEVTFKLDAGEGNTDEVVFKTCIQG